MRCPTPTADGGSNKTPQPLPFPHVSISTSRTNNHGQGTIERKIFLYSHDPCGPWETLQGSIRVNQLADGQNVELMQPVVKNAKSHETEPGCQAYFFFVPEDSEEGKEEVMNGIEM